MAPTKSVSRAYLGHGKELFLPALHTREPFPISNIPYFACHTDAAVGGEHLVQTRPSWRCSIDQRLGTLFRSLETTLRSFGSFSSLSSELGGGMATENFTFGRFSYGRFFVHNMNLHHRA